SLRYVAVFQDRWLALLGWCAAALSCKVRDRWIGWSPALQWSRLPLVVNNCRFLILPDVRIPNLASRILSLNLKRLALDWTNTYGHPVCLAETFVDPHCFKGTCYKAAGWVSVGLTLGFRRASGRYLFHNHPKIVFVRPLHLRARELLCDPYPKANPHLDLKPMELSAKQAHDLIERLSAVPDPRKARGRRHKMISVLAISLCAIMSNARSFAAIAEWAGRCSQKTLKRLYCTYDPKKQRYIPPSEPTIRRMMQAVDAEAVDQALCGWWIHSDDAISVDGKTVRGARQEDGRQVHLLSAFLQNQGAVIAQRQVDSKTNEITTVRPLLDPLQIEGKVVSLDALHTQHDTATYLVEEKHADYLFTVKDNQPTLKADIEALDLTAFPPSAPDHQ
ncbi:MAG: ISAs1 family transposase, partial [Desulfobacteraceae bacterium]